MVNPDLQHIDLSEIIARCAREAHQARLQELGHCFELFRRAIEGHDQAAWVALEHQYRRLMLGWVHAYPGADLPLEDSDGIVQEALERFWRSLTKRGVTEHFDHVGALLKYLRQCVIATILDQQRRAQRRQRLVERLSAAPAAMLVQNSPEETIVQELYQSEQLQHIRQWLQHNITNPQERRILALSYEHELTPAQIAAQFPAEFADAQTVRRMKERVLKRARRALVEKVADPESSHT